MAPSETAQSADFTTTRGSMAAHIRFGRYGVQPPDRDGRIGPSPSGLLPGLCPPIIHSFRGPDSGRDSPPGRTPCSGAPSATAPDRPITPGSWIDPAGPAQRLPACLHPRIRNRTQETTYVTPRHAAVIGGGAFGPPSSVFPPAPRPRP